MTRSGCDFCAIIRGADSEVRVLYSDGEVTAFFPLNPATRGHTLVVPNRHVADFTDLTEPESRQLGAAVRRTARAVRAAVSPDGLNIIQSTGAAATQSVPHVHFHVLPRWDDDRMTLEWPDRPAENEHALDQLLHLIRSTLPPASEETSPDDRRQHLSFIQAIVTRMSQASSSAKTWLLPIVTLTFGYAVTNERAWISLLGVLAVVIFGTLDANYLKQERAFRTLYDRVASGGDIPAFSLNLSLAGPAGSKVNYWPDWEDLRSWAIAPVYGPLLLAGISIAVWARCA